MTRRVRWWAQRNTSDGGEVARWWRNTAMENSRRVSARAREGARKQGEEGWWLLGVVLSFYRAEGAPGRGGIGR
jgi:hypothetical protein